MLDVIDREPIRLRSKSTERGESLYLDINVKGCRKKEFLNLYILRGTSETIKKHNREVIRLANDIRIQRLADIYNMGNEIASRKAIQTSQVRRYLWLSVRKRLQGKEANAS